MKLWVLGSGSNGNAVLIQSGEERIVIDAGFGPRILASRLKVAGATPESITSCFLTHEHSDHISGVRRASRKWQWPIFASAGTINGPELDGANVVTMPAGTTIALDRLQIQSVRTPHDARESVGFVVTEMITGVRAAVFYDIGHVSPSIRTACANVDILVIEANHDDHMLRTGPYAPWLQARIAGRFGHLNNGSAGEVAAGSVCPTLNHVVLAHLSQQCNDPSVAMKTVGGALRRTRFRGTLTASSQDGVIGPFQPRFARAERPVQLDLGF